MTIKVKLQNVALLGIVVAAVMTYIQWPDIKRYLQMKSM